MVFVWLFGCNSSSKLEELKPYFKTLSNANSIEFNKQEKVYVLSLSYDLPVNTSTDKLASIMALSMLDTADEILKKDKISEIKIALSIAGDSDTFLFQVPLLYEYRKGILASSMFVQNMLKGAAAKSQMLIDTGKISVNKLLDINDIGKEIYTNFNIQKVSQDGFSINPEDPRIIKNTVSLSNVEQKMTLTFEYDISTHKIFYFGVNDED